MNPTETKLPDKPSALIRVALADLEKCELDPRYKIDMRSWHVPNSHCKVCLAGAVMAKSLGAEPSSCLEPYSFSDSQKLLALDAFREGDVIEGLDYFCLDCPDNLESESVTQYDEDPATFKHDMNALADELEAQGL